MRIRPAKFHLAAHRCHDFRALAGRWRRIASQAGSKPEVIATHDGHPILLPDLPASAGGPSVCLSAGIHGDEPAGTEGPALRAERHLSRHRRKRNTGFFILPCLNPRGLIHNRREDASGTDLNRGWENADLPVAAQARAAIKGRRFDLALSLHEDFDARGLYLYEPFARAPHWGERLLASLPMPPDPRRRIDGSAARGGLIRRRVGPDTMPELPDAIVHHLDHAAPTLTPETPSEFSLADRVACQCASIETALKLL